MVFIGDNKEEKDITFYEYSNVSGWDIPSDRFLNIVYLAPFDHLRGGFFHVFWKMNPIKIFV